MEASSELREKLEARLLRFVLIFTDEFRNSICSGRTFLHSTQIPNTSGSRVVDSLLRNLFFSRSFGLFSMISKRIPLKVVPARADETTKIPLTVVMQAAFSIFQKFEAQFMVCNFTDAFQTPFNSISEMAGKLAAAHIDKCIMDGHPLEDLQKEITNAVLVGSSKRVYEQKNGGYEGERMFEAEFFENPGIFFRKENLILDNTNSGSMNSNFGFRLPFDWESAESFDTKKYRQSSLDSFGNYNYILIGREFQNILHRVMTRLQLQDPELFTLVIALETPSSKNGKKEIFPINFPRIEFPLNCFTRKKELNELEMKLTTGKTVSTKSVQNIVVISGLGGIGKTEFVRHYVSKYRHCNPKRNIIWVNSSHLLALDSSFRQLSKELLLSTIDGNGAEMELDPVVENVFNFLARLDCLFIFDDADQEVWNKTIFPKIRPSNSVGFKILITSRTREWAHGIYIFPLEGFSESDAFSVLKAGLPGIFSQDCIGWLLEKLDFYPLAIAEVIEYMSKEDNHVLGRDIENILSGKQIESLSFLELFYRYTTRTKEILTVSFEKIRGNKRPGELALEILDTLAFLAPRNIPREFLMKDDSIEDERAIKKAVGILIKYSIIDSKNCQRVLAIHPMVQRVVRIGLEGERRENVLKKVVEILNKVPFPVPTKNYDKHEKPDGDKSEMEALILHMESCLSHVKEWTQVYTLSELTMENNCLIPLLSRLADGYSKLGNTVTENYYLQWIINILSMRSEKDELLDEYIKRLSNSYEKRSTRH